MFGKDKKKKESFYDMVTDHAVVVDQCVQALIDYCMDPTEANGDFVKTKEKEADDARRVLVSEINATFITPIDRDDLFKLSTAIDDLADYAWNTVRECRIYDIVPDQNLTEMVRMLKTMSEGIIVCTQKLEKDRAGVQAEARKVKKIENKLNMMYHRSIAELFDSDDFHRILKYREVYSHMNHASDRGDHCADILMDIAVKL